MVKAHKKNSFGFTLLELVVTIAIFTTMLGIALSNYGSFSANALFANDVESAALALREAQIYGIGVKGKDPCGFSCAYGVRFVNGEDKYVPFVDKDSDDSFDLGESLGEVKFSKGVKITGLACGGSLCSGPLDVLFKRPSPDAIIKDGNGRDYRDADISITRGERTATTKITRAGQISTTLNEE